MIDAMQLKAKSSFVFCPGPLMFATSINAALTGSLIPPKVCSMKLAQTGWIHHGQTAGGGRKVWASAAYPDPGHFCKPLMLVWYVFHVIHVSYRLDVTSPRDEVERAEQKPDHWEKRAHSGV